MGEDEMTTSEKVVLSGSASIARTDATVLDTPPDMAEVVQLVLLVRRREEIPDSLVTGLVAITRDELAQKYGADPADIRLVSDIVEGCGLRVVSADAASRRVVVEGTLARAASAFNVKFSHYEASDAFIGSPVRYRGHGDLHMPADLDGVVVSVFGLDNQPRVIPMFRLIEGQPQIVYTPPDMAKLYAFPAETDGNGQTLAIVTVTGGYHQQDVDAYFAQLGLPVPSITVVSVNGVQNAPGPADQPPGPADIEAALDVEIAGALVPAGGNDEHDGGSHVNYPASSPHVLSIGGTTLVGDPGAGTIDSETVWNAGSGRATGGGVSNLFDLPDWQEQAGVPNRFGKAKKGRGVPDVAANADANTGYQFLLNGKIAFVGGTSAATPLWAALVCRLAQAVGRPLGLLQPLIYREQTAGHACAGFRDISTGDNGSYAAAPGWDPNTGLGSPDGTALLNVLREAMAAPMHDGTRSPRS
jgi:kumamolisin